MYREAQAGGLPYCFGVMRGHTGGIFDLMRRLSSPYSPSWPRSPRKLPANLSMDSAGG